MRGGTRGYSRVTGKVACLAAVSGPGAAFPVCLCHSFRIASGGHYGSVAKPGVLVSGFAASATDEVLGRLLGNFKATFCCLCTMHSLLNQQIARGVLPQ